MASDRERLAVVETKIDNINERVKWFEAKITIAGVVGGVVQRYAPDVLNAAQVALDQLRSLT